MGEREVSELEIRKFCESMDCDIQRVSVKTNEGLDALFDKVIDKCVEL